MRHRRVKRLVRGHATTDGAGVKLIRVLAQNDVYDIDPFLMMDAFDSKNPDDYMKGFPMHPHRGIETITYLMDGRMDHRDSIGNSGTISAGQAQWMTAGSGILHEEMPMSSQRLRGLQFWLNLPQKDKMKPPAYFDVRAEMMKSTVRENATVRVIAGEYGGLSGIVPPNVQVLMLDVNVSPGKDFSVSIPSGQNSFIFLFEGDGRIGQIPVAQHTAAILDDGDVLEITAGEMGARFLLLAGKPLNEPIAWGGPLVMNTQEEVRQAFEELRNGTFIK